MHEKLPLAIGNAQEIAAKAAELVLKLQEIDAGAAGDNSTINALIYSVTIFALACFVGYHVTGKIAPALYSSLMSLATILSGIIIIAAIIIVSSVNLSLSSALGFFVIFLAAVNIVANAVIFMRLAKTLRR